MLDDEYMLLLWKNDEKPTCICDVFWLKRAYDAKNPARSVSLTCSYYNIFAWKGGITEVAVWCFEY